jgi:hypothetical protein
MWSHFMARKLKAKVKGKKAKKIKGGREKGERGGYVRGKKERGKAPPPGSTCPP